MKKMAIAVHGGAGPGSAYIRQHQQEYKSGIEAPIRTGYTVLDENGNIAAATSTGGTECCYEGRIADSTRAGAGTYANNETCAVSTTGDGEFHIRFVSAFHISALVEYKELPLKAACDYLIHEKCRGVDGDMGLIAINQAGEIAMSFNSKRMHRGWKTNEAEGPIEIY